MPFTEDGPEYVYECMEFVTCDAASDTHGLDCERINDQQRADFYMSHAAEVFAPMVQDIGRQLVTRLHPSIVEEFGL